MALWIISYHIEFQMDDGEIIVKKDMRTIENPDIDSEDKARNWISDQYENSQDPMVDMTGLLAGVKSEKFLIDEIILHQFDSGNP